MSFLLSALSLGGQCDMNYKQAKDQRLHVELWLMKVANLRNVLDWDSLPERSSSPALELAGDSTDSGTPNGTEKKNTNSSPNGHPQPSTSVTHQPAEQHPVTSEPLNDYQTAPQPIADHLAGVIPNGVGKREPILSNQPAAAVATTPERPRPPIPAPTRPATSRLRSTVSLNTAVMQPGATDTETVTIAAPTRPDKPFVLEQLQATWNAFARLRHQQYDSATEQLVMNRELVLDGTVIRINLDNTLQVGYLTDLKPDLMGYLREQLQNSQIQLEHTVTLQEVKKMIYSSQDKFNFMAEKNPALLELRKVLNLEVDY
jgi:DNA polymerase-3 subunit gamma/tau